MHVKKKKGNLLDLGRQMQEIVDRAFRQAMFSNPVGGASWVPFVDIAETPEAVLVILEVPGVRKSDVDVQVENGLLRIRGKRCEFLPQETTRHHHIEIDRGAFSRVIQIPPGFDLEAAEAKLQDGLLQIRLPKLNSTPSRIEVTDADEEEVV